MPTNFKKILLILGAIFFLVYSWPTIMVTWPAMKQSGGYYISSWPDSMANYFFIEQLVKNNSLSYKESLNFVANDTVQPRSVNVFNHQIVPTGFLGFILLLGVLAKIIGLYGVFLITPLFAIIAVWAFYGLVRRLFDDQTALWAAVLLFILPPFWYYASLPMLPNVLFLSLVVIAYYFYFKQIETRGYLCGWLSGVLLGLALIIRPMEFVWLGIILVLPVVIDYKQFKVKRAATFLFGIILPIIILLVVNQKLYGQAFFTGYLNLEPNKGSSVIGRLPPALATNLSAWLAFPKLIFVPFGFHPKLIFHNLKEYFVKLLWPWCLLLGLTFLAAFYQLKKNKPSKAQLIYFWSCLSAGLLLIIYYGSWLFDDKLTLRLNTIGLSYVRYWLPLYLLFLPSLAWGLTRLSLCFKQERIKKAVLFFVVLSLLIFSWITVYLKAGDGLRDQAKVISDGYQLLDSVKKLVDKETVIICDREDKILWPEYSVVVFNNNYLIWAGVKNIIGQRPIYYLSRASETEIRILNERLQEFKITLEKGPRVNDKFILYSLKGN